MIVRSNPNDLDHAEVAYFDSDSPTNDAAIREIDAEAERHGLVRTREYWLQTFALPNGKVVRRGFCYRPATTGLPEHASAHTGGEVEGASSAQIVRQMRDQE